MMMVYNSLVVVVGVGRVHSSSLRSSTHFLIDENSKTRTTLSQVLFFHLSKWLQKQNQQQHTKTNPKDGICFFLRKSLFLFPSSNSVTSPPQRDSFVQYRTFGICRVEVEQPPTQNQR